MIVNRLRRRVDKPDSASPLTRFLGPQLEGVARSFWLLRSPLITESWAEPMQIDIVGWIASPDPITDITFTDPQLDAAWGLHLVAEDEIESIYGIGAIGFRANGAVAAAGAVDVVELRYTSGGTTQSIAIPTRDVAVDESARRSAKHARVEPLLRCPTCPDATLTAASAAWTCSRCGAKYATADTGAFDFLPSSLRDEFQIVPTDNVSSNTYDGVAINIINRLQDGLILDCGAGLQSVYWPNVVNVEIVGYPSTDVLAVGERLPFADSSFDAVFSFAVLEHVKHPARCADELMRVLKPGGVLYGQVPFLQPVHAFPNHFFNMTAQGLVSLFEAMDVQHCDIFPFGQPMFGLHWMLHAYAGQLPEAAREHFMSMTVAELMDSGQSALGADWVTELSNKGRSDLSCCNYILALKRMT